MPMLKARSHTLNEVIWKARQWKVPTYFATKLLQQQPIFKWKENKKERGGAEPYNYFWEEGGRVVRTKGGSEELKFRHQSLKFNYFPWDFQEEIANSISPCQERLIKKIK